MTIRKQQSFLALLAIAATLLLSVSLASLYDLGRAHAQEPALHDAGGDPYRPLFVDAGVGAETHATPPSPVDPSERLQPAQQLRNPVDDPIGAYDDIRAARKQGWAAAILACVVMATAGLARAAERWPSSRWLAWFAANRTAIFVASGIGTIAAAAFNALVLGGTMMAASWAAIGAALAMIAPKPAAR